MSRSDDELDYLLSRGKLGGSQRERILEAALDASRDGVWARWRRRVVWGAGGLTLATGAAALLLLLPRAPGGDSGGFTPKGSSGAPLITVSCLGAMLNACPPGSRVAFVVEGGRDKGGFLTAYAEPVKRGERVWYLTNEAIGAPQDGTSSRVVRKAAVIGDGQPAGAYRVHAIFSQHPVARGSLSSLAKDETLAQVDLDLVVPQ
jgi:hypothetical protein